MGWRGEGYGEERRGDRERERGDRGSERGGDMERERRRRIT